MCILKASQVPLPTAIVVMIVYAVELATLIAVAIFALGTTGINYDIKVIAFGSMYAVMSVATAVYKPLFDFIRFVSCIIHNKDEHKIEMTNFKMFVLVMESCIIAMTLVSLMVLIPQQGDIISIVVNCTGIICVSQLDEQLFSTFNIKYFAVPEVVDRVERADIFDWIKEILPPLLMALGYAVLIVVSLYWLPKCGDGMKC